MFTFSDELTNPAIPSNPIESPAPIRRDLNLLSPPGSVDAERVLLRHPLLPHLLLAINEQNSESTCLSVPSLPSKSALCALLRPYLAEKQRMEALTSLAQLVSPIAAKQAREEMIEPTVIKMSDDQLLQV